jgi:quercetin dioxygenase-like cupin family protein
MSVKHVPRSEIPNDRAAIEQDGFTVGVTRFDPPSGPGAWHHHGDHHVVAYLLAGTLRVDSGPSGTDVTEASAGDLVYLEPGTVHRETYGGEVFESVALYLGSGPGRVDVDAPAGTGRSG